MDERHPFTGETPEGKKERLRPALEASLRVFQNPDQPLHEGALSITRNFRGQPETIPGLVVLGIQDDAIELSGIEADGEVGNSVMMTWDEITDARSGTE